MPPVLFVVIALGGLAALVIWLSKQAARSDKAKDWPTTEATIQSVGKVVVSSGRSSYTVDVCDFSYKVNDEYYSGRLTIDAPFLTDQRAPKALIHQKFQVRYDPKDPEKFSKSNLVVGGFPLSSFNEPFGEDIDPIDLNIDKL